jgi:hypothetical protein
MAMKINENSNHFKKNPELSRLGIIARQEKSAYRDTVLRENRDRVIELRGQGMTVSEISKAILGDDDLQDMGATCRFIESLPLERLRHRYG